MYVIIFLLSTIFTLYMTRATARVESLVNLKTNTLQCICMQFRCYNHIVLLVNNDNVLTCCIW